MGWLFSKGPKQDPKSPQIQGSTARGKLGNLLPRQSQPEQKQEEEPPVVTSALKNFPPVNPYRTNLSLDDVEDLPVSSASVAAAPVTSTPEPSTDEYEDDDYGLGELTAHDTPNLPADCLNTLLEDNVLSFISTNKDRPVPQFQVTPPVVQEQPTREVLTNVPPPQSSPKSMFSMEAEQIEGLAATRTSAQAAAMEPVVEEPESEQAIDLAPPPETLVPMEFPEVTLPEFADMTVDLALEDLEPPTLEEQLSDVLQGDDVAPEESELAEIETEERSAYESAEEPSLAELFNDQEIAATEDGKLDFSSLEELDYGDIDPNTVVDVVDDDDSYEDILPLASAEPPAEEALVIHYDDDDLADAEERLVSIEDEFFDDVGEEDSDENDLSAIEPESIEPDDVDDDDIEALFHSPTFEDEPRPRAAEGPSSNWLNTATSEALPTNYGLGVVFEQPGGDKTPLAADTSSAFDLDLKPNSIQDLKEPPAPEPIEPEGIMAVDRTQEIDDPRNRMIYQAARSAKNDLDALINEYFQGS